MHDDWGDDWYRIQGFLFLRATLMVVSFGLIAAVGIGLVAAVVIFALLRLTAGQPAAQRNPTVPGPRTELIAAPNYQPAYAGRSPGGRSPGARAPGARRHVADIYAELCDELAELDGVFPLQVQRAMQNPRRRPGLVRAVRAAEAAAEVEMAGRVSDAQAFVQKHGAASPSPLAPPGAGA